MQELGLQGFDSTAWYGLAGPAGLPQEVVTRWTQALAKVAADKAVMQSIDATGCDTNIMTPAQTIERIKADHAKWGNVVKQAQIRAE
jgi:tripartite-type tricarboxylate transporter receptor subunit TctC